MTLIKFGLDSKNQEYYWTLIIEEGWVQSAIWKINEEKEESVVVATSSPVRWENDENLIETSDTSLSATIQNLPEGVPEPSKTVFGVPSSWVTEGQISPGYLEKIRHICSKLSLEPTGFVVLSEAIAFLVKTKEESSLNAVVIGLSANHLELSVFKFGKLVGSTKVARSVSLFDDTVEGLSRFADGSPIPSRFLIYDGKEGELDEAKEALVSADWLDGLPENIKFVHSPKVETIDPNDKVLAVSLAGSSEIGKVKSVVMGAKSEFNDEEKDGEKVKVVEVVSNIKEPEDEVSPEEFGFVRDGDVSANVDEERIKVFEKNKASIVSRLIGLKDLLSLPGFKINAPGSRGKKTLVFGFSAFFVIVLTLLVVWWFLPKATVNIFISPRILQEKDTISVDINAVKSDLDAKVIPGNVKKVNVDASKTKSTTGTKVIGDKAKGVVKLRNGTPTDVSFSAGTVLEGSNGLKFSLDESVSVSAAISPTSPGNSSVPVTAEAIGSEYNLAKDETFKVSNYPKSEIDAISESDFSGGTSREIAAVSEKDVNILKEELTEELKNEAEEKIKSILLANEIFIEGAVTSNVLKSDFSNKVGDEASTLELSLSLEFGGLVVDELELDNLASKLLEDETPQGFLYRREQIDKTFKLESQKDSIYQITVSFVANLLPDLDIDDITSKIVGKTPSVASEFLQTIPGFKRAEIHITPRFPGKLGTLPKVKNNISIEVSAVK